MGEQGMLKKKGAARSIKTGNKDGWNGTFKFTFSFKRETEHERS